MGLEMVPHAGGKVRNFRCQLLHVLGLPLGIRLECVVVFVSKGVYQVLLLLSRRGEMVWIVIKGCCYVLMTTAQKGSYIRSFARE